MILVVGEALVDVVHAGLGATTSFVGGSPLNVAVTLARLGMTTRLLTALGADENGNRIRRHLDTNGVALDQVQTLQRTSTAAATLDSGGAATYEFDIEWAPLSLPMDINATALHAGSLATCIHPGADTVVATLSEQQQLGQLTLTFDPNIRPALMGPRNDAVKRVEYIATMVDVVKASDEDIRWLYPGVGVEEVAHQWLSLGPAVVIVTLGGGGATAVTRAGAVRVAAAAVAVVDTVGAGDSFMGAVLYGLDERNLLGGANRDALRAIDPASLRRVLEQAASVAGVTVSRAGANPPFRSEL